MKKNPEKDGDSSDDELGYNVIRRKSHRDPITIFFKSDDSKIPCCRLVVVGNYYQAERSKKKELFSDIKYAKLNEAQNIAGFLNLKIQDGVSLQIWESSYVPSCGHCYGYPIYASATMIVCVPNSAEDLKTFFATLNYAKYGIPSHTKIVYLNMFDIDTDEFRAIEALAEKFYFSNRRLFLDPITADELIKVAIQHSREVCAGLIQPVVDPSEPQMRSEKKCCFM